MNSIAMRWLVLFLISSNSFNFLSHFSSDSPNFFKTLFRTFIDEIDTFILNISSLLNEILILENEVA